MVNDQRQQPTLDEAVAEYRQAWAEIHEVLRLSSALNEESDALSERRRVADARLREAEHALHEAARGNAG